MNINNHNSIAALPNTPPVHEQLSGVSNQPSFPVNDVNICSETLVKKEKLKDSSPITLFDENVHIMSSYIEDKENLISSTHIFDYSSLTNTHSEPLPETENSSFLFNSEAQLSSCKLENHSQNTNINNSSQIVLEDKEDSLLLHTASQNSIDMANECFQNSYLTQSLENIEVIGKKDIVYLSSTKEQINNATNPEQVFFTESDSPASLSILNLKNSENVQESGKHSLDTLSFKSSNENITCDLLLDGFSNTLEVENKNVVISGHGENDNQFISITPYNSVESLMNELIEKCSNINDATNGFASSDEKLFPDTFTVGLTKCETNEKEKDSDVCLHLSASASSFVECMVEEIFDDSSNRDAESLNLPCEGNSTYDALYSIETVINNENLDISDSDLSIQHSSINVSTSVESLLHDLIEKCSHIHKLNESKTYLSHSSDVKEMIENSVTTSADQLFAKQTLSSASSSEMNVSELSTNCELDEMMVKSGNLEKCALTNKNSYISIPENFHDQCDKLIDLSSVLSENTSIVSPNNSLKENVTDLNTDFQNMVMPNKENTVVINYENDKEFIPSNENFQCSSAFHCKDLPDPTRPSVMLSFDPLLSVKPSLKDDKCFEVNKFSDQCSLSDVFESNKSTVFPSFEQNLDSSHKYDSFLQSICQPVQLSVSHINSESENNSCAQNLKLEIDKMLNEKITLDATCERLRNYIKHITDFMNSTAANEKPANENNELINNIIIRKKMTLERDQALEDLRNVEKAFSELMIRYNKAKSVLEQLKENEVSLTRKLDNYFKQSEEKQEEYNTFLCEADEQINTKNEELIKIQKDHEAEKAALTAMLRKSEIKVRSLTTTFDQTVKDNLELLRMCQEFGYQPPS